MGRYGKRGWWPFLGIIMRPTRDSPDCVVDPFPYHREEMTQVCIFGEKVWTLRKTLSPSFSNPSFYLA